MAQTHLGGDRVALFRINVQVQSDDAVAIMYAVKRVFIGAGEGEGLAIEYITAVKANVLTDFGVIGGVDVQMQCHIAVTLLAGIEMLSVIS